MARTATDEGTPRRLPWWQRIVVAVLLVGSLGATFGVGAFLAVRFSVIAVPEVKVPDLVGKSRTDAEAALAAAGLLLEVGAERFDAAQPAGLVAAQSPLPGTDTRAGRPVRIVVSLGVRKVAMPDLLGANATRAQTLVREAGFDVGPTASAWDPTPPGRILAQWPPAGGSAASAGSGSGAASGSATAPAAAQWLASAGPRPLRYVMPDVVGKPLELVRRRLEEAGFRRIRVPAEAEPGARIASQEPRAGSPVAPADVVVLGTGR